MSATATVTHPALVATTASFSMTPVLSEAVKNACAAIAPTWPLDRFIAVNPYWGRIASPFNDASNQLSRMVGSSLTMPISYYGDLWQRAEISRAHLQQAAAEFGVGADADAHAENAIAALASKTSAAVGMPLLSDALDSERDLSHEPAWRDAITQQLTQFCAAYFDRDQADWHLGRGQGLYVTWRAGMIADHSIALLMNAPKVRLRAKQLPDNAEQTIEWALATLAVSEADTATLLELSLLRINGWAAWCAYERWQARLAGADDNTIVELLAIRLAWECLLDDGARGSGSLHALWHQQWSARSSLAEVKADAAQNAAAIWQRAHEIAYQRPLAAALANNVAAVNADTPSFQAAFCIDVRSEVFRRALEGAAPSAVTMGFAGFFGLPISYTPIGTKATRPQLPGLLAAAFDTTESTGSATTDEELAHGRYVRLKNINAWRPFERLPNSAFSLVESLGLSYLGKILYRSLPSLVQAPTSTPIGLAANEAARLRPTLLMPSATNAERATLAEKILCAMSLTSGFARLVLLLGHGSQTANNPHAAGLDCGACCGQTGEVNARVLAALLNQPDIREILATRGLHVPATTHFLAGLHNTTLDEVTLFDVDLVPASHQADLQQVNAAMRDAGERARAERAPALGLSALADRPDALKNAVTARSKNWSETRPEWGLVNNAAFVVAPRTRTRDVNLHGRSFLHDYDYTRDTDGSVLELIMTAPMVVTHWINMQYHASTVDNGRYGSGNKVLHNVVGGRLGVFEGNGGDLRIGLPMQSLHDGEKWIHTPLRLSVFIQAPRAMIETVVHKHAMVKQLLDNRWIHLFRLEGDAVEVYRPTGWERW